MTTSSNTLVITIPTTSPQEEREALIKAIASAMRWYAGYTQNHVADKESIEQISVLLTTLSEME